jgi:paraquat-inducible protein B
MKLKPSPALVGAFVLGALALGSAAVLTFGGRNPFAPRRRLVVYFDESVSGLERGAAVKVHGVQSGRVTALIPTLSPDSRSTVVAAICDMKGAELTRSGGELLELSDAATLKTLVAEGLRARLKPAGISGESTIDLDFYDPRRYPVRPEPAWTDGGQPYPSVPAIPSVTGELLDDLQAVMHQLSKTDFEGLSRKLGGAARSVEELPAADAKKALQQIGDAALSVKDLADFLERNPNAIISGKKQAKP